MRSHDAPVVIIGAGIGGLTLALLLRRRGIAAEVLEQAAEPREVGAAVGLAANATRVLADLGLAGGLARASTEPSGAHLAAFRGWHPAVTEMIGAVPQSPRWGLFAQRPLACWSRGRVVLLGDAAHAMLPHQGQGANQTIEDAAVLAAELGAERGLTTGPGSAGRGDLAAALHRYTARRRVRTRQVQMLSWAASAELHLPDGPAARRRDARLPGVLARLAWIHGYDVLTSRPGDSGRASEWRP